MVVFALVLAPFVGQISVPALAGIMVQVDHLLKNPKKGKLGVPILPL